MKTFTGIFAIAMIVFSSQSGYSQCNITLPDSTFVITKDTTIVTSCSNGWQHYLICPGIKLTYNDTSVGGCSDNFYLESGAELVLDTLSSYAYRNVYAKAGATGDLNNAHWTLLYEKNITLEDTVGGSSRVVCAPLTYNYSLLPGGVGCATTNIQNSMSQVNNKLNFHLNGEKLHFSIPNGSMLKVRVYDMLGKEVLKKETEASFVDLRSSKLKNGLYIITYEGKEIVGSAKFVYVKE